jgi:hypothetical protein
MLDVHPPDHAAHSWRDFFIHIATIVVGLCIAVGIEQMVEAIHHHHQRAELVEQMHAEAEHNLPIIQSNVDRLLGQYRYIQALRVALLAGKATATGVEVQGVAAPGMTTIITTASRGTWQAAQAAGTTALLPPEQAKLYARLDFNAEVAQADEAPMFLRYGEFASVCDRAAYDHLSATAVSHLTINDQRELIYQADELNNMITRIVLDLSILRGGDEAIVNGATTLDQMYPYQNAVLGKLDSGADWGRHSFANLFGALGTTSDGASYLGTKQRSK